MKYITFVALIMSLVMVVSCGGDKKKKNKGIVIGGVSNPMTCVPSITSGQEFSNEMILREIQQACFRKKQAEPTFFQEKLRYNSAVYFTATLPDHAAYPQAYQQPGMYPNQPMYPNQQYGMQQVMPVVTFH